MSIPLPTGLLVPITKRSNLFLFQETFLQPGYLELLGTIPVPETVCDLGVNHGYFALVCEHYKRLHHIDTVTRYAGVDANPSCLEACRRNFALNLPAGTYVTELGCVGTPGTTIDFYVDKNDLLSSAVQKTRHSKHLRVPALDLAAFLKKHFPAGCDLLKVDVQGAEDALLKHWGQVIADNCRAVMIEYHPFCALKPAEFRTAWEELGFTASHFPWEQGEEEFLALFTKPARST